MKRIFSGIQPSGFLHIGNYLGAIKQWIELQNQADEAIFCIVDLHAITLEQKPEELRKNILSVAALYLAAGVDPEKSHIFVQSTRPEHTELAWILNCYSNMGELSRMTQFKDKSTKYVSQNIPVGLFDYPILMASDILLYNTTHVPVGEDQKQHIELTRNIAIRLNSKYGELFTVPEPIIKETSGRIMGLDDPTKKMSKSATSSYNYIALTDDPETIRQKIKRAVTDSGMDIKKGPDKPAVSNLLNIFSEVSGKAIEEIEEEFAGKGYGQFKEALAEEIINYLKPIQTKYGELLNSPEKLKQILYEGSEKIAPTAQKTLESVKKKIGLGLS